MESGIIDNSEEDEIRHNMLEFLEKRHNQVKRQDLQEVVKKSLVDMILSSKGDFNNNSSLVNNLKSLTYAWNKNNE